jgi:hypothetical protein
MWAVPERSVESTERSSTFEQSPGIRFIFKDHFHTGRTLLFPAHNLTDPSAGSM